MNPKSLSVMIGKKEERKEHILHNAHCLRKVKTPVPTDWKVVGTGTPTKNCPEQVKWICNLCGSPQYTLRVCHNNDCPECLTQKAARSANRVERKIRANSQERYSHIIISLGTPCPKTIQDNTNQIRRIRYLLRNILHFQCGVMVYHHRRIARDADDQHYHVLGFPSRYIASMKIIQMNRKFGYVIKVVKPVHRRVIFPTLFYTMTHFSWSETIHNYSYFGNMPTKPLPKPWMRCKKCTGFLHLGGEIDTDNTE